jgi:hypothetical protein
VVLPELKQFVTGDPRQRSSDVSDGHAEIRGTQQFNDVGHAKDATTLVLQNTGYVPEFR